MFTSRSVLTEIDCRVRTDLASQRERALESMQFTCRNTKVLSHYGGGALKKPRSTMRKASNRRLLAVTGLAAAMIVGWAGAAIAGSSSWSMGWRSTTWESPRWSNNGNNSFVQQYNCGVTNPWDASPAINWELWRDISFLPDSGQGSTLFVCSSADQGWSTWAENGNLYIKFVGIEGTSATANGYNSSP